MHIELCSKLVEGTFPDYTQVIPKQEKGRLTAKAGPLMNSLKRLKMVVSSDDGNAVDIKVEGERLCLSVVTKNQSATDYVDIVAVNGEHEPVAMSLSYLMDTVKLFDSDHDVILSLRKMEPNTVKHPERDLLRVIMPMRKD